MWQYQLNASTMERLPAEYSWLGKFHGSESWLLFSDPEVIAEGSSRLYTLYKALREAIGQFAREPEQGPGWPEVGAPEDIAVWGDIGVEQTAGYVAVNRSVVDVRGCTRGD
ncbi:hypothetical protein F5X68DRAFT_252181 [Plectosphaerella plurivora]|uniref:Uncharacterized protein n=1 Tax=Plectosphaerella plurivora TaxID=936078 RepID=A0A9P8VGJ8_9PEZI|nr:hypothetical protein F5X68DRAFT_252181 [Plectosphaerella plurivora]